MSYRRKPIPEMGGGLLGEYLYSYALECHWYGDVVECGSWLGAGTDALAQGLRDANAKVGLWCFDRWKATSHEVDVAARFEFGIKVGQDLLPIFVDNICNTYDKLHIVQGNIAEATWKSKPIGLFVLDAAKWGKDWTKTIEIFSPYWVPNNTIVVFQDYYYGETGSDLRRARMSCQRELVESNSQAFRLIDDRMCGQPVATFRYLGGLRA